VLVAISDIHLTDDGFSKTTPAQAFRIFRERLRDMAYDASWRADGAYRPIEELDLVLLGDVLDVIRSERWAGLETGEEVRPWSDPGSAAFQQKVREIVAAILERNEAALSVLRSLKEPGVMTLPPAAAGGGVARVSREPDAPERVPVRVRIHYVAGNHDWFVHLPGAPFDEIRRLIVERMGLAQPAEEPFPYRPEDSAGLAEVCERHRAYLRHGDYFDVFNFHGDRRASSIGDAIVIDLLSRFCLTVEAQLGPDLPEECLAGLRQIDHIRPLLLAPLWVDSLLRRTCADPKPAREVKRIWDGVADRFFQIPFVRECAERLPPLTLDKLALALKFSKGVSLHLLGQLFSWFNENLPCANERPNPEDALSERVFKNRRARAIVYGHTHDHLIAPLDVTATAGGLFQQIYANTGTWRVLNRRVLLERDPPDFVSHWVMTYVGLYQGDERGGRPYEAWSGVLALPARSD
jgi:hypothetical protein